MEEINLWAVLGIGIAATFVVAIISNIMKNAKRAKADFEELKAGVGDLREGNAEEAEDSEDAEDTVSDAASEEEVSAQETADAVDETEETQED